MTDSLLEQGFYCPLQLALFRYQSQISHQEHEGYGAIVYLHEREYHIPVLTTGDIPVLNSEFLEVLRVKVTIILKMRNCDNKWFETYRLSVPSVN